MAYICEKLVNEGAHLVCSEWVVFTASSGFLPELSTTDKDDMLLWMLGIFIVVFTVKQLKKLFNF